MKLNKRDLKAFSIWFWFLDICCKVTRTRGNVIGKQIDEGCTWGSGLWLEGSGRGGAGEGKTLFGGGVIFNMHSPDEGGPAAPSAGVPAWPL